MNSIFSLNQLKNWVRLLRWDKPSGRLILLIPAGWSLWLAPSAPPSLWLTLLIIAGGISVSGAGCIANDLWDREIDKNVERTKLRPLAQGSVKTPTAWFLLFITLIASLIVVLLLPISTNLCLKLASFALIPILVYPSSKRWFKYPQALLAICWGFSVLIPWAASQSSLNGGWTLYACWIATMTWTFGFDTVYAMADKNDDKRLGLNSSALSLGQRSIKAVSVSYLLTSLMLGTSAFYSEVNWRFWPIWLLASIGMQLETIILKNKKTQDSALKSHFRNQVLLGGLLLLGLILGKST